MKKSYIFLFLCVFTNFFVQIFFDKVSESLSNIEINIDNALTIFFILTHNPVFWLSIIFFISSAIFWLIGIKKVPLSNAFSITSLNYIFVTIYAVLFLKEVVSLNKIISLILVILGVYLMAIGSKKKYKRI